MQLLPLTLAVAGLPVVTGEGKYYTEGQMENRAGTMILASAYRSPGAPPFGSGSPSPRSRIFVPFCVSGMTLNCTWPPFSVGAATSPPWRATRSGTGTITRIGRLG